MPGAVPARDWVGAGRDRAGGARDAGRPGLRGVRRGVPGHAVRPGARGRAAGGDCVAGGPVSTATWWRPGGSWPITRARSCWRRCARPATGCRSSCRTTSGTSRAGSSVWRRATGRCTTSATPRARRRSGAAAGSDSAVSHQPSAGQTELIASMSTSPGSSSIVDHPRQATGGLGWSVRTRDNPGCPYPSQVDRGSRRTSSLDLLPRATRLGDRRDWWSTGASNGADATYGRIRAVPTLVRPTGAAGEQVRWICCPGRSDSGDRPDRRDPTGQGPEGRGALGEEAPAGDGRDPEGRRRPKAGPPRSLPWLRLGN